MNLSELIDFADTSEIKSHLNGLSSVKLDSEGLMAGLMIINGNKQKKINHLIKQVDLIIPLVLKARNE